jgi:hypothetical protein
VHDLVDGEGGCRTIGMGAIVRGEFLGDLVQPFVNWLSGRALSEGKLPTTPALHCAITSSGRK